jgi:16S rRNA processing protein RimM
LNSNFFDIFSFQEYTEHGSGFIARVKDVDSREKAEEWKNKYIYVSDKEMPSLGLEEYYWYQLLGLTVQTKLNKDNQILGKVVSIIETGSNDVLVVQGDDNSIDLRERSIPCSKEFLVDVNLDDAIITVAWDPSF